MKNKNKATFEEFISADDFCEFYREFIKNVQQSKYPDEMKEELIISVNKKILESFVDGYIIQYFNDFGLRWRNVGAREFVNINKDGILIKQILISMS